MAFAKKYVLEKGPIILEMDTYRYHGHSMSDPGSTYRTRDEISSMRQLRDPIEHVRKLLLEKAGADPAELKKIEKVMLSTNLRMLDPLPCRVLTAFELAYSKSGISNSIGHLSGINIIVPLQDAIPVIAAHVQRCCNSFCSWTLSRHI